MNMRKRKAILFTKICFKHGLIHTVVYNWYRDKKNIKRIERDWNKQFPERGPNQSQNWDLLYTVIQE
jgi:hypothetical protein